MNEMTKIENEEVDDDRTRLIRAVQAGVPFASRPFAELGQSLAIDEAGVLSGLRALSEEGVLREISAVLEGSALGYDSALVAGEVPEEKLEHAVAVIVPGSSEKPTSFSTVALP